MGLGERIRKLRQERKWTQADLAERLGIQQKQISAYERGANYPSTEILIKLADTFDVSLDFIAFERNGQSEKVVLKDRELLEYFAKVDGFSDQDKNLLKEIMDLLIIKNGIKQLSEKPR